MNYGIKNRITPIQYTILYKLTSVFWSFVLLAQEEKEKRSNTFIWSWESLDHILVNLLLVSPNDECLTLLLVAITKKEEELQGLNGKSTPLELFPTNLRFLSLSFSSFLCSSKPKHLRTPHNCEENSSQEKKLHFSTSLEWCLFHHYCHHIAFEWSNCVLDPYHQGLKWN